jgi:paraquat-inducible protein B
MGSRVSPRVIGAFVVGGIALGVLGVLFFGGGKVFQEKTPYVIFFEGSVQGLHVGAPVVFRGVQVGQVAKVEALFDPTQVTIHVKVLVELVRDTVQVTAEVRQGSPQEVVEMLVQQGLRASLQLQSFVTQLLLVNLDFSPGMPIKRLGLDPTYPELPAVPSQIEQLLGNVQQAVADLGQLPLEALLAEALGMLKRINTLLDVPELKQTLVSLHNLVTDAQQLLKHTDAQVVPLGSKLAAAADSARATLEAARVAVVDAQKLFRDVDGQVAPLAGSAKETLVAARGALGQAQKSLATLTDAAMPALKQGERALGAITNLAGYDSVAPTDLAHTLRAIEDAAQSIHVLADMLQQHPEALLRGKGR